MVQFKILSGTKAGTLWGARRFPVRVGRGSSADLRIEESGVWEQHFQVDFQRQQGFVLKVEPNALVTVNSEATSQTVLRNGDIIALGSLRLQFWLSPTQQVALRWREVLTWVALAAVCLSQVALVYWVLR